MPSSNIYWVKLFLSLLDEDDRFLFQLNESQQLLYLKLLLLAGRTCNQIVKRTKFICSKINYSHEEECFEKDIARIMEVFPKFKANEKYYYFENFHEMHNQIQDDKWGIKAKEKAWKKVGLSHSGLIHSGLSQNRIDKNRIDIKKPEPSPLLGPAIDLLRYYTTTYQKVLNAQYVPAKGKDLAIFATLLETLSETDIRGRVDAFLSTKDDFTAKAGHTIGVFKSYINKLQPKKVERGDVCYIPRDKRTEEVK